MLKFIKNQLVSRVQVAVAWLFVLTALASGGVGGQQYPQQAPDGSVTGGAGQGQFTGPPVITNRPPSTIPPPQFPAQQLQVPMAGAYAFPERNEFQDFVAQSVGRELPLFGHNLFTGAPSTFAPLDRIPVTSDYVVGPGDELLIRAWGQVDIDYRTTVDRDGAISIPKVGNINVAGIRFQDLQAYLRTAVGRVFRNFELNVAMGQLRSIQIFVVGHVARPGAYTVSSLSTLMNAVFASGGPTARGSMRGIQLKRGDKLVTELDMYDLLLKGDKSKDAPLLPGDVIFIPPVGQLVAVSGSVNTPAIYEIRGKSTIGNLIDLAGGLSVTADGQRVSVERILDRRSRQVEHYPVDPTGLAHALRNGDVVQVLSLSPRFDNAITVRGNVAVPARHPWREGIRVRDVLPDRESLIVPDYWLRRNLIVRRDATGRSPFAFRPDIAAELRVGSAGRTESRRALDARDPAARAELDRSNAEQRQPDVGQQQLRTEIKNNMPEVNWDYAVIERLNLQDLTTVLVPFNLAKAILEGDPASNIVLQPGDVITIFSKGDIQVPISRQTKFVRLEGEIASPGVYQVLPGETLRQLVTRIGGLSPNAYLFGGTFTRESTRISQQKRLQEAIDRLEQEIHRNMSQTALTKEDADTQKSAAQGQLALVARLRQVQATGRIVMEIPPERSQMRELPDLVLEDGDVLNIPSRPSTVAVVGTVYNENAFLYREEKRVSDYLAQAGGPTKDADIDSLYVIRSDGSVISRRQSGRWFSSGFENEQLMPGDTLVVPEKLDKYRFAKELKDWSQIFYQFALGVAGLKVLRDF